MGRGGGGDREVGSTQGTRPEESNRLSGWGGHYDTCNQSAGPDLPAPAPPRISHVLKKKRNKRLSYLYCST